MHWLAPSLLDYSVNGRVAGRQGNRQADAAPHGAYRCRDDRWCVIAVRGEAEWRAFRAAIGDPAWAGEERFATHAGRKSQEDALDVLVEGWTRERTPEAVMTTLQAAGVAAGVVQRGEDLLEHDPQLRHRGFWRPLDHPAMVRYHAPQHAFQLPDAPCDAASQPADRGGHGGDPARRAGPVGGGDRRSGGRRPPAVTPARRAAPA